MRLKTFQAKTMSDALRQIKEALGEEAIIVSSRDEPGGVRVTAAVEQMPEESRQTQETAPPKKQGGGAEAEDPDLIVDRITDTLLRHRLPAPVSDKILTQAMATQAATTEETLAKALARSFGFRDLFPPSKTVLTPLMLVGPPGAGKTLMTAKLATQMTMDGRHPFIITTDTVRAGGVEQLKAFLDILRLPLHTAATAAELDALLSEAEDGAQAVIDTGGLNPFDAGEMKALARMMHVRRMESVLVLPAGIDAEESAEIAMTFEILGVTRLIPTRLDFARRLGGLFSAADRAALSFACASHTAQVANGTISLTPETLARMLLPRLAKGDSAP